MSSKKPVEENNLYINIELPDTRKRLTILYEKKDENETKIESLNLILSNQVKTFSGLLSIIVDRFKIESSLKSKIRLLTTDGRRVSGLTQLYNNQLLSLTFSKLTTSNEFTEDILESLNQKGAANGGAVTAPSAGADAYVRPNKPEFEQLPLFAKSESNQDKFMKDIKKLKATYNDRVVIGESFPYCAKVIVSVSDRRDMFFLYLREPVDCVYPGDSRKQETRYRAYSVNSESKESTKMVLECLDSQTFYDVFALTHAAFNAVNKISAYVPSIQMASDIASVFPAKFKLQTTTSISDFTIDKYKKINYLVKTYNVPFSLAREILFKTKWNIKMANFEVTKLKLTDRNGDLVNLLNATHKSRDIDLFKFKGLTEKTAEEITCSICYCEYKSEDMIELICGHRFCRDDLAQYFKVCVDEGNGNTTGICCPRVGCVNKCVDEVTVESILPVETQTKCFVNFLNDIVFTGNGKWCPNTHCNDRVFAPASRSPRDSLPFVLCACNAALCLFCGDKEFHWPIKCHKRTRDSENELESLDWIAKNTTSCPKCRYPVQKNQGCNHMTCSRCHNEFCYSCGKPYGGHNCVSYSETGKVARFINMYFQNSPVMRLLTQNTVNFKDPLVQVLYGNLTSSLFMTQFVKIKKNIEDLMLALVTICSTKNSGVETELITRTCGQNFSRITMEVAAKGLGTMGRDVLPSLETFDRNTVCLSSNICMNGSKKILLPSMFVFSQFSQFKQEIVKSLKKQHNIDLDINKIKLLNEYGGEIRASNEILLKELIYVCADKSEKFLEPEEYFEPDQEEKKYIEIQFGNYKDSFEVLESKKSNSANSEKLKKDAEIKAKLQESLISAINQVVVSEDVEVDEVSFLGRSLRISSQEEIDEAEKEINSLMGEFEDEEGTQLEMIGQVLEMYKNEPSLTFEEVYQICYTCKSVDEACMAVSDFFDEKNQFKNYSINEKEVAIVEKIQSLFPGLSITIIHRAMDQNEYDLEKSTNWILSKYATLLNDFNNNIQFHNKKAIKNNNNNVKSVVNTEPKQPRTIELSYDSNYDDDYEDEDDYEEYEEMADNFKLHKRNDVW